MYISRSQKSSGFQLIYLFTLYLPLTKKNEQYFTKYNI